MVEKIRRDAREERLWKIGIHPSQQKWPMFDYGPGYREVVPKGYINEDCYMSETDSEGRTKKQRGLLPLRSEIEYKKRLGMAGPTLSVNDYTRIAVTDKNGRVVFKRRRKQFCRATNTGIDDNSVSNLDVNYSGSKGKRARQLAKKNNSLVRGIYYTAAAPTLKPKHSSVMRSTQNAFGRRSNNETSGERRTEYSAAAYEPIDQAAKNRQYLARLG